MVLHETGEPQNTSRTRTFPVRSVLNEKVKSAVTVESFTIGRSRSHIVFVPDCSGSRRHGEESLGGKPGHELQKEAVVAACQEFERLAPERADISVVVFDVKTVVRVERIPARNAEESLGAVNFAKGMFGSTSISEGLRGAERLASGSASEPDEEPEMSGGYSPGSTVLCVLSDGGHNTGEDPLPIAEGLKLDGLQIATVWYPGPYSNGRKIEKNRRLMENLASPELFFEASHVSELPSILKHAAVTITRTSLR